MPFDFLRRGKSRSTEETTPTRDATTWDGSSQVFVAPFDGLTPEWRLRGRISARGRLSDALNRRQELALDEVQWAPADGTGPLEPAPGIRQIDPYDLVVILAGPDTLPIMTPEERQAHRVHKVRYDVSVEAPPFRIIGTVMLAPGASPDAIMDRSSAMFVPIVDGIAFADGREVAWVGPIGAVLVNRFYIRAVEQVERETGLALARMPWGTVSGG